MVRGLNFGFRLLWNCSNKALISCAVAAHFIVAFSLCKKADLLVSTTIVPAGHGNLSALKYIFAYLNV